MSCKSDEPAIDRETGVFYNERRLLAATIEAFLADRITAFEFDDQLDKFRESADEVVQYVTEAVWFHYDDCDDHVVCLSKTEWDYFQRLLLLLSTECRLEVETQSRRIWSWRQIAAITALVVFAWVAFQVGWGDHLVIVAIPFGIVSILLSGCGPKHTCPVDPYLPIVFPFASLSDLEAAYRSAAFRKTQYPSELSQRAIRTKSQEWLCLLQYYLTWMVLAPVPLLVQSLPKTETHTGIRAV